MQTLGSTLLRNLFISFYALAIFTSCGLITGSGDLVTTTPQLTGFTQIRASASFDVVAKQGPFSIEIQADDNIIEFVDAHIEGEAIVLRLDSSVNVNNVTLRATISLPDLELIDLSGASSFRLDSLTGKTLVIDSSGASDLNLNVTVAALEAELSGASSLTVAGSATRLALDISGASYTAAKDLQVQTATVELSGASSAILTVTDTIAIDASGASDIILHGNPTITEQSLTGASSLEIK